MLARCNDRGDASNLGVDENGFVLVSALLLLAALTATIAVFTREARLQVRITANAIRNTQAELDANGAIQLIAARLALMPSVDMTRAWNGTPVACIMPNDTKVMIRIQDHGGLVDLNAASPELLSWAFRRGGLDPIEANQIAVRVVDARDPDDARSLGGAERADYAAAGLPGPRNASFRVTYELGAVLDVSYDLATQLLPFVTVHSRSETIDPQVAPPIESAFDLDPPAGATGLTRARFLTITAHVETKTGGALCQTRHHRTASRA